MAEMKLPKPPEWWVGCWNDPRFIRAYIVFVTFGPGMLAGVFITFEPWGWIACFPALFFVVVGGGLAMDQLVYLSRKPRRVEFAPEDIPSEVVEAAISEWCAKRGKVRAELPGE